MLRHLRRFFTTSFYTCTFIYFLLFFKTYFNVYYFYRKRRKIIKKPVISMFVAIFCFFNFAVNLPLNCRKIFKTAVNFDFISQQNL